MHEGSAACCCAWNRPHGHAAAVWHQHRHVPLSDLIHLRRTRPFWLSFSVAVSLLTIKQLKHRTMCKGGRLSVAKVLLHNHSLECRLLQRCPAEWHICFPSFWGMGSVSNQTERVRFTWIGGNKKARLPGGSLCRPRMRPSGLRLCAVRPRCWVWGSRCCPWTATGDETWASACFLGCLVLVVRRPRRTGALLHVEMVLLGFCSFFRLQRPRKDGFALHRGGGAHAHAALHSL